MATHSAAYIPTNRKPGEYIMSQGWFDGMLNDTGWQWYKSAPRMADAIRATMMLGGSPVFAPAGDTVLDIREIDYVEDDIAHSGYRNDAVYEKDEDFIGDVAITIDALTRGDWTLAESTAYGKMTLEEKMEMGITLNTTLHTISDFSDLPLGDPHGNPVLLYDTDRLVDALTKNKTFEPNNQNINDVYITTNYFYHDMHQQWWGLAKFRNGQCMYLPLAVAFAIEGGTPFEDVKTLHSQYSEYYAKDIVALTAFEAARQG